MEAFNVKTSVFEGPLDVLLDLIEKRKLHINDVALSHVTDDFIEFSQKMGSFPISVGAHFILVASTLLLIKSKSLLPSLSLTNDETQSVEDLELRLRLLKKFKDISQSISQIFGCNVIFEAMDAKFDTSVFAPHKTITPENLKNSILSVINALPKIEKLPETVIKKVISLEEMIVELSERVKTSLRMSFKEFTNASKEDKVVVIVSFLAMLELVRRGILDATQSSDSEILIHTDSTGMAEYK